MGPVCLGDRPEVCCGWDGECEYRCLFLSLTISQHLSFSPCPGLSWHLFVLCQPALSWGWRPPLACLSCDSRGSLSPSHAQGALSIATAALSPTPSWDVVPVEPHSCGQWKQLLMCMERLLAVFLHCPFLGQGKSVPVAWSVRPRKVAGFSTVCLRSLSHMLGSWSLEGLSPNGLLPFKVARFWQRWSRKLLFQSMWMIFLDRIILCFREYTLI